MIELINSSPYFIAFTMLMMNLGGKFLVLEIPPYIESLFQNPIYRKLIFFCIFFMATRDIRIAFFLTLCITIVFQFFLKESSIYSILPEPKPEQKEKEKEELKETIDTSIEKKEWIRNDMVYPMSY
jgi:hypothetical protein